MLTRFGLLTASATGATVNLLLSSPLTIDTSAWYWPRAAMVFAIIEVAAGWAGRVGRARV